MTYFTFKTKPFFSDSENQVDVNKMDSGIYSFANCPSGGYNCHEYFFSFN